MDLKKIFFLLTIIVSVQSSSGSGAAYVVKVAPKPLLTVPSSRGSNSPHFGPQNPTITSASAAAEIVVQMSSLRPPVATDNIQPKSPPTTERTPQSQYRSLSRHTPKNLAPLSPQSAVNALAPHPSPAPSDAGSNGDVDSSPRSVAHSISKSQAEKEKETTNVRLKEARALTTTNDLLRLENALTDIVRNGVNLRGLKNDWKQFKTQQAQKNNETISFSDYVLIQMKIKAKMLIEGHGLQCEVDAYLNGFIKGIVKGVDVNQAAKTQEHADKKKAQEDAGCGCW